jgi:hypothetical protein
LQQQAKDGGAGGVSALVGAPLANAIGGLDENDLAVLAAHFQGFGFGSERCHQGGRAVAP